jgi:hypothetical protein
VVRCVVTDYTSAYALSLACGHFGLGTAEYRTVFPKHFSTATQFLERQSVATHIALLDKKKVFLERKKYVYLLLNIILQKTRYISHNEACVIGALVSGYC